MTRLAVVVAKAYLNLMPAYPGEYLLRPVPLERAEMEYDDECSEFGFHHFFNQPLEFAGKVVLDLGCGYGGRSVRYKELGAKRVIALEVSDKMVTEALQFASTHQVGIETVMGTAEQQPFSENSVDTICAYDVLEHVERVDLSLQECYRVLKPGGTLYAVFPPFYHPINGSHFSGYLSRSPFDTVLFSTSTLKKAAEEIMAERHYVFRPSELRPGDKLWGMNGITVRQFLRLLRKVPFTEKKWRCDPLISPLRRGWKRWRMKYYAWPFRIGSRIPIATEVCTHRIVAELQK